MGIFQSKQKKKDKQNSVQLQNEQTEPHHERKELRILTQKEYDQGFIQKLTNQFENNMQQFVLNLVVLSVCFFEHYDANRQQYFHLDAVSQREKDLNFQLQVVDKECIMPDMLLAHVNKQVRFMPHHGPKKFQSEPLIPQRIFVTHNDIEVLDPEEDPLSRISESNAIVLPEYSENRGYVKLKINGPAKGMNKNNEDAAENDSTNEKEPENKNESDDDEKLKLNSKKPIKVKFNITDDDDDDDEIQNNQEPSSPCYSIPEVEENIYDEPLPSTSYHNKTEVSEKSEDTYIYTRINETRIPQPINMEDLEFSRKYPQNWIKAVTVKNMKKFLNDSDDENIVDSSDDDVLFVTNYYCDSDVFMKHFTNRVFPYTVTQILKLAKDYISNSTYISGIVYFDIYDEVGNVVKCEVIPSLNMPWPSKAAYEFILRESNQKWPLQSMLADIRKHTKVVIMARGFQQKRGINKESNLEWEILFPEAEKYLQARMSQAQMKAYLVMVALYKTFIEPKTAKMGLLIDHLRMLIFWECEKNYDDWNERMLGTKILSLLQNLYKRLARRKHYDFFIRNKNMFENIPGGQLRQAQEQIHLIREAPAKHFIQALRNLRYTSKNFYPELDFKKLYSILKAKEGLQIMSPLTYQSVQSDRKRVKQISPEQEWEIRQMKIAKEKNKKIKAEQDAKSRVSNDSIQFEWDELGNFDHTKKVVLLDFFIQHFIEMSKASLELATAKQAKFYLKQAEYLNILMEKLPVDMEKIEKYNKTIKKLGDIYDQREAREQQNQPPATPKRNTVMPTSEFLVNNKSINIQNIATNYNSGLTVQKPSANGAIKSQKQIDTIEASNDQNKVKRVISFREDNPKKSNSFQEEI